MRADHDTRPLGRTGIDVLSLGTKGRLRQMKLIGKPCSVARTIPSCKGRAGDAGAGIGCRRQAEGGYEMSRTLIIFGLVLPVAGVAWPSIDRLGLGRLPGDIAIERSGFSLYFPLTTSLIISVVVSVILWLVNR